MISSRHLHFRVIAKKHRYFKSMQTSSAAKSGDLTYFVEYYLVCWRARLMQRQKGPAAPEEALLLDGKGKAAAARQTSTQAEIPVSR